MIAPTKSGEQCTHGDDCARVVGLQDVEVAKAAKETRPVSEYVQLVGRHSHAVGPASNTPPPVPASHPREIPAATRDEDPERFDGMS